MTSTADLRADFQNQVDTGFHNMSWASADPIQSKATPQQQQQQGAQMPRSIMSQMAHDLSGPPRMGDSMSNPVPPQQMYNPDLKNTVDHRLQAGSNNVNPNEPINSGLDPNFPNGAKGDAFYKNKKVWIGFVVVAIIVGVAGYFLYRYWYCKKPKDGDDEDNEKFELDKFRQMQLGMGRAPAHFPNPPQMSNMGARAQPSPPLPLGASPGYYPPTVQQQQPPQLPQQQQPPQQGRREQQHGPPGPSSGFPQAGPSPGGVSEENDPMFTKLSDLP